ncbi:ATP-dependent helicase [Planctomycetales bacterium]|nr:ATP-dependent helicase [Planctomycetales bacterium]
MLFTYPDELPITQARGELARLISDHQVVIVAGATGSGKTTQIPKICLELGRRAIACTEPRRVAAVSVAERVASELAAPLGEIVGYQIRFAEKSGPQTQIKFMTDGVLLAQARRDPLLRGYDTVIIDEAHERTLNIDFLLGGLRRLADRRRDLKIIVSSATLAVERFSQFFAGAPVLNVEGRTFPIEIFYAPPSERDEDAPDEDHEISHLVGAAVTKLWRERGAADTLIFLAGEQDIRETCAHLENMPLPPREILPLYGRMSSEQQRQIFYPRDLPRLIVATNVAETSITVPRVRYVIDSGLARLKRYNPKAQIEMLPVERVSQAAAAQRAGRCGRVAPGVCVRLYSLADFADREEFTPPEILRTSLAGVILQMRELQLGAVEDFPFLDPPPRALVKAGYAELQEIGALDEQLNLTAAGRQLAALPLSPRYGKILLTAAHYGVLPDALTIVAALTVADPRLRPPDGKATAKHRAYADQFSDFRAFLHLWHHVEREREKLSGNQFHHFCREHFLSWRRLKEWRETRAQLADLMTEASSGRTVADRNADREPSTKKARPRRNEATANDKLPTTNLLAPDLHRALLSGLLGRVGYWDEDAKIYRGAREAQFVLFPGSGVKGKPAWVMAAEIVETSRVFARTAAAIEPEWLEREAAHLLKYSYSEPFFDEKFGVVRAHCNATLFGLPVVRGRVVHYGTIDAAASRAVFIREGLVNEKLRCRLDFLDRNRRLIAQVREREEKLRRRDLLISADALAAFFAERLPPDLNTGTALERWIDAEKKAGREPLLLRESDIVLQTATGLSEDLFPPVWRRGDYRLALSYKFDPGAADDGVTCAVPVAALAGLTADAFAWLVPGLLGEKVAQLLRGLPRSLRKEFAPVGDTLDKILPQLRAAAAKDDRNFLVGLAEILWRTTGVKVTADDFRPDELSPFLRMNFRVVDGHGAVLSSGRDLAALQTACATRAKVTFLQAPKNAFERSGITQWDFAFPLSVPLSGGAVGYPTLQDCGASVTLLLSDTPAAAARATRKGLRRLLYLALGTQVEKIAKSLGLSATARQFFSALKGQNLPEKILDAAADGWLTDAGGNYPPRTAAEFAQWVEKFRRDWYPSAQSLALAASATLEQASRLYGQIFGAVKPAWQTSYADLRRHFAALIHPQFIGDAGATYLPRLPRYVEGVELRLQKLAANLARDEARVATIAPFWDYCAREFAALRQESADAPRREKLRTFRWLLEDFRLTLFAQELGAFTTVSEKKLRELMA